MKAVVVKILNYIVIFVIVLVIADKIFNISQIDKYTNNSPNISSYFTTNPTNMPIVGSVAKLGTKKFGNFGKFGNVPMIQYCSNCSLKDNCLTPDYKKSFKHKNVCQECRSPEYDNRHNLNRPIFVAGRSAGRGRRCRQVN